MPAYSDYRCGSIPESADLYPAVRDILCANGFVGNIDSTGNMLFAIFLSSTNIEDEVSGFLLHHRNSFLHSNLSIGFFSGLRCTQIRQSICCICPKRCVRVGNLPQKYTSKSLYSSAKPIFSVRSCKLLSCWACVITPCSRKVFRVAPAGRREPCAFPPRSESPTPLGSLCPSCQHPSAAGIVPCCCVGFKYRFKVAGYLSERRFELPVPAVVCTTGKR